MGIYAPPTIKKGRIAPDKPGLYRCVLVQSPKTESMHHLHAAGVCFSKFTELVTGGARRDTLRQRTKGCLATLDKEQLDALDSALHVLLIRYDGKRARVQSLREKRYRADPSDEPLAWHVAMVEEDDSILDTDHPQPDSLLGAPAGG